MDGFDKIERLRLASASARNHSIARFTPLMIVIACLFACSTVCVCVCCGGVLWWNSDVYVTDVIDDEIIGEYAIDGESLAKLEKVGYRIEGDGKIVLLPVGAVRFVGGPMVMRRSEGDSRASPSNALSSGSSVIEIIPKTARSGSWHLNDVGDSALLVMTHQGDGDKVKVSIAFLMMRQTRGVALCAPIDPDVPLVLFSRVGGVSE